MEQVIHDPPAEPFPESSYGVLTERLKSRLLESRIQAMELSPGMVTMITNRGIKYFCFCISSSLWIKLDPIESFNPGATLWVIQT